MNDTAESELIFRRLSDPFPIGPAEYSGVLWVLSLVVVLLLAGFLVTWMYLRDARTVRWWAVPLAKLRFLVYLLLGMAFLLPACQTWETVEKRSRVLVILDVSPSVTQKSDDNSSDPAVKPKTRMDKILTFLTDEQIGFMAKLVEKNPVYVYRFGTRLDEESQAFDKGSATWTKDDWDTWVKYDFKPWALRGVSPAGQEIVRKSTFWQGDTPGTAEWAIGWTKLQEDDAIPAGLSPDDTQALKDNRNKLEKRVDVARSIVLGTNVPDSLTTAVNREAANMVQGIIVFTDGRSNLGSDSAYRTLKDRATREKMPIFTVAVGEARETIAITITDVQAPDRAPPDEQFKVMVEADGVGLGNTEVDVKLDIFQPGRDPKKDAPDYTLPAKKLKFLGDTTPPHGQVEFVIDPEEKDLPETLTEESKKLGRRRQFKQGAWTFIAKIAKDKREVFPDPEHASPPRVVQIIDKPLRVLLFASAASWEYQTLRTLLVRETQQNRAELSICLQNEGGREGTTTQDVPPERLLTKFPTHLDTTDKATAKPEDKFYNLNQYDLIIAFDPDWSELSPEQVKALQSWVDNLGGGFIYVAAPLNTYQLARADETGRLKPLLDIMPVIPDDVILVKTRPIPRTPRRLILKPNPEFDVLKLEDDIVEDTVGGWERFFTGRDKYEPSPDKRTDLNPTRGFFSYYPVKSTKLGSSTLAEFLDVDDKGDPVLRPWIVTTQPARGRTAFLASGEFWRLRAYYPVGTDYYNRFWIKLSRYIAANRDVKASRGRILMNKEFISGSQVRVQTRMLAPNGSPYEPNALNLKFRIEQWNATADQQLKQFGPYELKAKKGGVEFDGYYAGQVLAEPGRFPPGDFRYKVVVDVPDSPGDTITSEFLVKKSDPELDNIRPDFAALEQAAGTLEDVKGRIKDPAVLEKLRGSERNDQAVKLAFKLSDTDRVALIPACLDQASSSARNRGAVDDLWDKPLVIPLFGTEIHIVDFNMPSWALYATVLGAWILTVLTYFTVVILTFAKTGLARPGWGWVFVFVLTGGLAPFIVLLKSLVDNFKEPVFGWAPVQWMIGLSVLASILGTTFGLLPVLVPSPTSGILHVQIGWLIPVIVGLLGTEWLIRKLLRLA